MQPKAAQPAKSQEVAAGPTRQKDVATTEQAQQYCESDACASLLQLQRSHGNRFARRIIQAKLEVSQPGDLYEREADEAADRIMKMPDVGPGLTSQRATIPEEEKDKMELRSSTHVQTVPPPPVPPSVHLDEEEEKKSGQAKQTKVSRAVESTAANGILPHAEEAVAAVSNSVGQPLPPNLHRKFEQALGADLSAVRVHTGIESIEANKAVSARAFATGNNIYFNEGQYSPEGSEGRRLLAHEVAHTVQQSGSPSDVRKDKLEMSFPSDAHETEAEPFVQSFVAGNSAAMATNNVGAISRLIISRQQHPAQSQGQAQGQGQQAHPVATIVFDSTFEVAPGGLAPGKERTQETVFRGDRLTFRGRVSNITESDTEFGVVGRVVGISSVPATYTLSGDSIIISITVGNMGTPKAGLGQAPDLVDAKPYAKLKAAPFTWIGDRIFKFKVVADLSWLSDRADIASELGDAAYTGLLARLKAAFVIYKAAWTAHTKALEDKGKREQLKQDIALGILFAAVGGAGGGIVQQLIKGQSSALDTVGAATAAGDVVKYIVRLTPQVAGANRGSGHTSDTPSLNPSGGGATASGGGFEPDVWMASVEASINKTANALKIATVNLKTSLSEAWAAGLTDRMDQDPVDIVQPHVDAMNELAVPTKTQQEYAQGIWRNWLENYGYVLRDTYDSDGWPLISIDNNTDRKLRNVAKEQCGPGGDALVDQAMQVSEANARRKAWDRAGYNDIPTNH